MIYIYIKKEPKQNKIIGIDSYNKFSASLCFVKLPDNVGSLTRFRLKKPNFQKINIIRINNNAPSNAAPTYIHIDTPVTCVLIKSGYAVVSA